MQDFRKRLRPIIKDIFILIFSFSDQDLPIFPVEDNYLNAVKMRVNLARELDKIELHVKKANSEAGWLQKAAEEMDIIVDNDLYPFVQFSSHCFQLFFIISLIILDLNLILRK